MIATIIRKVDLDFLQQHKRGNKAYDYDSFQGEKNLVLYCTYKFLFGFGIYISLTIVVIWLRFEKSTWISVKRKHLSLIQGCLATLRLGRSHR